VNALCEDVTRFRCDAPDDSDIVFTVGMLNAFPEATLFLPLSQDRVIRRESAVSNPTDIAGPGPVPADVDRLTQLWETPKTFLARLATTDHKSLGIRYIVTAFVFFLLGGIEAAIMRLQLAQPGAQLLTPDAYNQLFTMHGTTMMFLFIQPVLAGFSFYLTPLMIGARELAFPRLNTFSYYVFVLAGIFLYASFAIGQAPNAGWFNYTPLSDTPYDLGYNIDFYALGLIFLGISTTAGAVNSVVTICKLRAPGMTLGRMPLFLWSSLTMSASVIFAMPALTLALVFLELSRRWHFPVFDPTYGGTPFLWQHLFWIFGHPWVYIVFLPAMGMLSMIIPVFSRRAMIGHNLVALATVATGILGFGVWAHHMFATGIPRLSLDFFGGASMLISIPSALQIIAWMVTMFYGRVVMRTPMWFAVGFIIQFLIGGITGVMTAIVPIDWQVHDTYFVVGHLHYVLAGGSVFALFAAIYYWFPKMTGHLLRESLGQVSFWVMFVGFNLTFFPMHIAGFDGMPRRVYTYESGMGLETPNLLSTVGALIFVIGVLLTLWNIVRSRRGGVPAGHNPWSAASLEWSVSSPPESYNFVHIPLVSAREPLWDNGWREGPAYDTARLTPRTSVVEAELEQVIELPEQNLWTLVLPVGLLILFAGLLMQWYVTIAVGLVVTFGSMARWAWPPSRRLAETEV
jgi:cytochrome c oxidase subunit 1/cytochrome c oxidase subunit I+III